MRTGTVNIVSMLSCRHAAARKRRFRVPGIWTAPVLVLSADALNDQNLQSHGSLSRHLREPMPGIMPW